MGTTHSVLNSQVHIDCQLCQGRNKIQWKCVTCHFLMCSSCKDNIHLRITKDHHIININDIGELDSGQSFNFSDVHCIEHSEQVCCSYCRTCKKVVCVKCVMKVHNGHEFVDEEEFLCKKEKLWEGQNRVKKKLDELCNVETKLKEIKESEESAYSKAKLDIQDKATTDVDQYYETLIKLDQKLLSVNQAIYTELRNINREKGKLQEIIGIVNLIRSSQDICQFLENFDELITSLNCEIETFDFGQLKAKVSEAKVSFKVVKEYTTDLRRVGKLTVLSDQTLLISENTSDVLQHVKFKGPSLQVISNLSFKICGIAVNSLGEILVSTSDTKLNMVDVKKGELTVSVHNVEPLMTRSIHVTQDHRVIIGAISKEHIFPAIHRSVVIVMDQKGNRQKEYEHDKNNKPLFTYPRNITSTTNGNIFVIDKQMANGKGPGRVVVLGDDGGVIQIYSGHPAINTQNNPFKPSDVLAMSSGSIVVIDRHISTIHILNSLGQLMSYHNLSDIGIIHPYSLALSSSGNLYIGCTCKQGSPDTYKAKLYELEYYGI
ncbi:protein wech-like [Mytilus edulis]|uniref:protein wech-like n=1 Tax=Mytilus edulis TaxID=6550 RepID=UPI0039EE84B1